MSIKNTDSVVVLREYLDSLKCIAINNAGGIHLHDSPVQAAIIVGGVTVLTVVLGFIFKDYFIPKWNETRAQRISRHYLLAKYKSQLFKASLTFEKRLHEIYRTRSHYLWTQTSISSFYDYKYKSSVYRLCVLLGWIRAFRLLESEMSVKRNDKRLLEIAKAIEKVESCFADGQGVEMHVAKAICSFGQVQIESLKENSVEKLSVEVDNLVQKFQTKFKKEYIADLDLEQQNTFIVELIEIMNNLDIPSDFVKSHRNDVIKEVSIKLALIYRDWQQAIGDLMLLKSSDHSFDVISFKTFERIWDDKNSEEKKWLNRAERIFEKLDLRVDVRSDSRIQQLKNVYAYVYCLLKCLHKTNVGTKVLSDEDFDKISASI